MIFFFSSKPMPCGALSDDDFSDDETDESVAKAFIASKGAAYRKEVRPTQEQLDKLPLRRGQNEIEFTVTR